MLPILNHHYCWLRDWGHSAGQPSTVVLRSRGLPCWCPLVLVVWFWIAAAGIGEWPSFQGQTCLYTRIYSLRECSSVGNTVELLSLVGSLVHRVGVYISAFWVVSDRRILQCHFVHRETDSTSTQNPDNMRKHKCLSMFVTLSHCAFYKLDSIYTSWFIATNVNNSGYHWLHITWKHINT